MLEDNVLIEKRDFYVALLFFFPSFYYNFSVNLYIYRYHNYTKFRCQWLSLGVSVGAFTILSFILISRKNNNKIQYYINREQLWWC